MTYLLVVLFQLFSNDSLYVKRCTEMVLRNPDAFLANLPQSQAGAPSHLRNRVPLRTRAEEHCRNLYRVTHRPSTPAH